MSELFDLSNFDEYKEDNCREVKKAEGGLPIALWESYSSFANSNGGVIILGVGERQDGKWYTTGLKNANKLKKNFWNTIHDTKKVSINLLSEKNVESYEVNGDTILVIYVPRAKRDQKPVYINNDLFGGCYRRDWEGDYHCTKTEVKGMLRDAADETEDMKIVENLDISSIKTEALKGFRNNHKSYRPEHVFNNLPDDEYLERIGAAGVGEDGKLHPTTAGLLMFGEEYQIVREFPEYFLDYREMLDPTIRWTDRLQSSSGDWSGNVFDFFFRVYNKISKDIKKPFKLEGIIRVDDTPVHKAVREALVNCLVNTDYFLPCGVVINKEEDKLVIENPGSIRTGKKQMLRGGISDPRNKTLMKGYNTNHYSLEMIIAVGFKVNSERAVQFRKWVNQIAKDYTIKGWVMDDERLKCGTYLTEKYFDEQLERIREIRASERKFYQKITDIYATAIDYDKNSATTRRFYATVQNKMHYAVHGHTAAELIVERANHTKENMGLTTWADALEGKIKKSDVTVARNYLTQNEMKQLNRMVTAYLDFAENMTLRHIPLTMQDWEKRLNSFIEMFDYGILQDAGKITAEIAKLHAETEFEKYRIIQDRLFMSDFDKYMLELEKNAKK